MSGVDVVSAMASRLLETSVVGGLLALAVWGLCRIAPALPPAMRCWLWWGVALKMVLGLLPLPGVAVPLLPVRGAVVATTLVEPGAGPGIAGSADAPQATQSTSRELGDAASPPRSIALGSASTLMPSIEVGVRRARPRLDASAATQAPVATSAPSALAFPSVPWRVPLALLWLAGLTVELARAATHLLRARRVVHAAEPVTDAALLATFDTLRARLDVPNAELRISRAAATPQVVGILRPVVLLPVGMYERLDDDELAMALGHELLHVRRADLLLGLVPALAARCFFFHPLARLVEREHALAREEACDAAVVARLAPSPRAYGRLLLELSLGCGAPLRAAAAAVTHPTLQRRLHMLLKPARPFRPALVAPLLLLGVCALVPLRVTAAREEHVSTRRGDGKELDAWIYFHDAKSSTMSGSSEDMEIARRLQRNGERLLWVRRGGEEWVIRDPALLARIDELFAPMRELGQKQAELGGKQAELGAMQAQLGAQQAQLGAQQAGVGSQQATISAQQAQINAQQAALSARQYSASDSERADLEKDQRELERQIRDLQRQVDQLGEQQSELGRMQGELGGKQNELGGKQSELGELQNELGRRQSEASQRAERALGQVLDEAIRSGQATRVD